MLVVAAVQNDAGRGAGRQEREIEKAGRRRNGDEPIDLRPPHEKLHADPGAKGEPCHPASPRIGIERLKPIQRRSGVGKFTGAMVEFALAAPNAAKIEAEDGKPTVGEGMVERVDHLVVHRPAMLRMGMKDQGDRRVFAFFPQDSALQGDPQGR